MHLFSFFESNISVRAVHNPQCKYAHGEAEWCDLEIGSCVIKLCCGRNSPLKAEPSSWRGGGWRACFVPPQLMLRREFGRAQAVQPLTPPPLSPPLYLFPPSHLIAFDKCPYWLHIIRCGRGSLRLYYSAHIPHLFSILHGWHTCICKVRMGPRLCQWNSFHWRGEVLVSALDTASNVTANLLEGVETARAEKSCSHKL